MKNATINPLIYVLIGLIIFGLLGLEFPVFFLSRLVDGRDGSQIFSWPVNWYGAVFHWTVTMLVWAVGAYLLYRWAIKKGILSELVRFKFSQRDGLWLVIGVVFVILYQLVLSRMAGSSIPQIWREYRGFQNMYGQQAWITAIFQNLYYLVEFVLVVMMIAFFQRGGELWIKVFWIPWGGIGLALTWGTIHLVTNPQGAVGVIIWALILGIYFVLVKKHFWLVWLVGLLGFII